MVNQPPFTVNTVLQSIVHTDINECSMDTHNCTGTCYNNAGSYTCDCVTGMELDTDKMTCKGQLELHVNNVQCIVIV